MTYKECPICDAEGQAYYSFPDHTERLAQCEDCNGSGTVDDDEEEEEA